jgi:hypothetical protein
MNPLVTTIAPIVVLLAAQSSGQTQDAAARRYELPNLDILELVVPPAWDETVDQPADGGAPTIQFRPREGAAFEIYITPDWPSAPDETVPDPETLRATVRSEAERIRDLPHGEKPAEGDLEIRRLQGANGIGFYFVATDHAPQPEEFRYMNQGALEVGDLTVTFTILTNEGQDAVVEEALAMLKGAVHRDTGLDQR